MIGGKDNMNDSIIICAATEAMMGEKKYESIFFDLRSSNDVTINPHCWENVPTGIKVCIPYGYFMEIRPRSGLAAKHGITVLNAPATIDADYRGEVMAIMINHSDIPFVIRKGDRICQARFVGGSIMPLVLPIVDPKKYDEFEIEHPSERGVRGLGSTGVH
jgi:dUTP pyrophosphatase